MYGELTGYTGKKKTFLCLHMIWDFNIKIQGAYKQSFSIYSHSTTMHINYLQGI